MVLILLLIILSIIYFYISHNKTKRIKEFAKALPGPPTLPFFGNSLLILRSHTGVLPYLIKAQETYGNVTRHWLGASVLYTLLTDPKDVEILLRDTRNIQKSQNYDLIKPWLGEGLITSTGSHWHTHRKIITPAFHFNILEKFVEVFNEKGKILVNKLQEKIDQEYFDIYPYINLHTFDAIVETAMGVKCHAQEGGSGSEYVQAIYDITDIMHRRTFSILHRSNVTFPFTKLARRQRTVLNIVHGYCNKVIQQRTEEFKAVTTKNPQDAIDEIGRKKRLAFLDLLLLSQTDKLKLSDKDIREEVDTFLFAGHDTTSTSIAFSLYYLANYPEVQQKLYKEIEEVLGGSTEDMSIKDLNSLKYLDQVIKEVMRIAPPVPHISRHLASDLKISNYTLPAGSAAGVFIYMLHRNPIIFPNPEKFDPDRFSPENSAGRHPYSYVPFSAGPRNCIGQKYAQLEMKSTLIKIVSNFRLLPGKPIDVLVSQIIMKSKNGINIKLEKRNKNP